MSDESKKKRDPWAGPIPCREDIIEMINIVLPEAPTNREIFTRIAPIWDVGWQTVRKWCLIHGIALPHDQGPRCK